MSKVREPILLAWSGGKDSMLTLFLLKDSRDFEIVGLISCVTVDDQRTMLRGVGRDLLQAQARALGLPLTFATVPKTSCYREHTNKLAEEAHHHGAAGVRKIAFGDLFLDEVRDAREERLEAVGMEAVFPLWQRDTSELAQMFIEHKFKAMITSVDQDSLDMDFVGRSYDRDFLHDLPIAIDPCGENGEFHTFVYDGPLFKEAVGFKVGEKFTAERFHYCDLLPRRKVASKRLKASTGS